MVAEQGGAREDAATQGHAPLRPRNHPTLPTSHHAPQMGKHWQCCLQNALQKKPACVSGLPEPCCCETPPCSQHSAVSQSS